MSGSSTLPLHFFVRGLGSNSSHKMNGGSEQVYVIGKRQACQDAGAGERSPVFLFSQERPSSQASFAWYSSDRRVNVLASGSRQRPRSAASSNRSTMARSAQGFERRRKSRTASSNK